MKRQYYEYAREDECGLLYRPGEVHADINHCKLKKNHKGDMHTTRFWEHDQSGFDWKEPKESKMEWPDRLEDGS